MKVLVAEDDMVTRRVLERTLSSWGYEVFAYADGAAAWDALQAGEPPELAVLDWMMPGMDGTELCRRIRRSSALMSTYVVLLTARHNHDDVVAGLDSGADDYVCKPIELEELRARVRVGQRVVEMQKRRLEQETLNYVRQLETTVAELERSRRRIVDVQEEGRRAISEELHGPVQTRLFMVTLKLEDLKNMLDGPRERIGPLLEESIAELDQIREIEIRQLSHRLHPSIISVGLAAGVKSLRDSYERWVPVDIDIGDDVLQREPAGMSLIPSHVRLALYRVADEALANVVKHSGADRVLVRLDISDDTLRLSVEDNGKGFELGASGECLGTATMKDYIGALGGSQELKTAPGEGTRIVASVSLAEDADEAEAG